MEIRGLGATVMKLVNALEKLQNEKDVFLRLCEPPPALAFSFVSFLYVVASRLIGMMCREFLPIVSKGF